MVLSRLVRCWRALCSVGGGGARGLLMGSFVLFFFSFFFLTTFNVFYDEGKTPKDCFVMMELRKETPARA